jgi:hypothetical protein
MPLRAAYLLTDSADAALREVQALKRFIFRTSC